VRNNLRCRDGAKTAAFCQIHALREAIEEAGCKQVARARGIDDLFYFLCGNFNRLIFSNNHRALF